MLQKLKECLFTVSWWTIIGCGLIAAAGLGLVIYILATRL